MKASISYITYITVLLFLCMGVSCKEKAEPIESYISGYKDWKRATKVELDYPVPGHGDTYRIVYANDISFKPDMKKTEGQGIAVIMQNGSVIVKEVYKSKNDAGKKEPALTYMVKDKDYPGSINGWVYVLKKPGENSKIITGRMCVGCHEAANERHPYFDGNKNNSFRDYLFIPFSVRK